MHLKLLTKVASKFFPKLTPGFEKVILTSEYLHAGELLSASNQPRFEI